MTTISVICAKPTQNPGMHSVDLACHAFLGRLAPDARVVFYSVPHPLTISPEWADVGKQLPFEYVDGRDQLPSIYDSDAILMWGDFLHASYYHAALARRVKRSWSFPTREHAIHTFRRFFLLSEASEAVLKRTISFGTTILANSQRDYLDAEYRQALERFCRQARRIWTRDVYSALKVSHLRGDYARDHLGIDCSFLLNRADTDQLAKGGWADELSGDDQAGVFFGGRTEVDPLTLIPLVTGLCERMKVMPDWIPWLPKYSPDYARHHPPLKRRDAPCLLGDLVAALPRYRFVVTDTYHLCLNAWRSGIPAVCVGSYGPFSKSTIGDKKKEIFHAMYEAGDFYVDVASLRAASSREKVCDELAAILGDSTLGRAIHDRIQSHRQSVERDLVKEMRHLLAI